ncbi:hypothetical protein GWI34_33610 [Actinomadura sp. DSM 109109]|nr:hypothetical protein [Actinomadura lepetitiana]
MSTRILGLLGTTAAITVALGGGVAAASAARTMPPPAPPVAPDAPQAKPSGNGNPAFDLDPFTVNPADPALPAKSDPNPDQNAANAAPKPDTAAQQDAAAPGTPPRGRSEARDGTDLKACEDARCQVEIKDGQTIRFDRRLQLDPLHIKIDGNRVTFSSKGRHGVMVTSMNANGPHANANYNGLTLRPHRAKNGAMILDIAHD